MRLRIEQTRVSDGPVEAGDILDEILDEIHAENLDLTRAGLCDEIAFRIWEADLIDDVVADADVRDTELRVTLTDDEWSDWCARPKQPSGAPGPGQLDVFGGEVR